MAPCRDLEAAKLYLGIIISEILYGRDAQPWQCFHILDDQIYLDPSTTFESATHGSRTCIKPGANGERGRDEVVLFCGHNDKALPREQRASNSDHAALKHALDLLENEIFPSIEQEILATFELFCFGSRSHRSNPTCLRECWTIELVYAADGRCVMNVFYRGISEVPDRQPDATALLTLKHWIERLPRITGRTIWKPHATPASRSTRTKTDRQVYTQAKASLERSRRCFYSKVCGLSIAPVDVAPSPPTTVKETPSQTFGRTLVGLLPMSKMNTASIPTLDPNSDMGLNRVRAKTSSHVRALKIGSRLATAQSVASTAEIDDQDLMDIAMAQVDIEDYEAEVSRYFRPVSSPSSGASLPVLPDVRGEPRRLQSGSLEELFGPIPASGLTATVCLPTSDGHQVPSNDQEEEELASEDMPPRLSSDDLPLPVMPMQGEEDPRHDLNEFQRGVLPKSSTHFWSTEDHGIFDK